jgi:anthranilate/para-aminobenzoate synthase component II
MLLMIDNYDSFTYNRVQDFGESGTEVRTPLTAAGNLLVCIAVFQELPATGMVSWLN